jgi:hypothetical protein
MSVWDPLLLTVHPWTGRIRVDGAQIGCIGAWRLHTAHDLEQRLARERSFKVHIGMFEVRVSRPDKYWRKSYAICLEIGDLRVYAQRRKKCTDAPHVWIRVGADYFIENGVGALSGHLEDIMGQLGFNVFNTRLKQIDLYVDSLVSTDVYFSAALVGRGSRKRKFPFLEETISTDMSRDFDTSVRVYNKTKEIVDQKRKLWARCVKHYRVQGTLTRVEVVMCRGYLERFGIDSLEDLTPEKLASAWRHAVDDQYRFVTVETKHQAKSRQRVIPEWRALEGAEVSLDALLTDQPLNPVDVIEPDSKEESGCVKHDAKCMQRGRPHLAGDRPARVCRWPRQVPQDRPTDDWRMVYSRRSRRGRIDRNVKDGPKADKVVLEMMMADSPCQKETYPGLVPGNRSVLYPRGYGGFSRLASTTTMDDARYFDSEGRVRSSPSGGNRAASVSDCQPSRRNPTASIDAA